MKTTWQLKSHLKLLVILSALVFSSCKDEDDPDPRQAFVGEYEMDDFQIRVFSSSGTDSTFNLSHNSEIEFEVDNKLDPDELETDLKEFLEDVITGSLKAFIPSVIVSIGLDDDVVVEISGNKFELDDYDFEVTASSGGSPQTFPCTIEGEGDLEGSDLTFDFVIVLSDGAETVTFEGVVEGERD